MDWEQRALEINWKKRKIGDEVWSFSTNDLTVSKYKLVGAEYCDHQVILKLMIVGGLYDDLIDKREENNVYSSYEEASNELIKYIYRKIDQHNYNKIHLESVLEKLRRNKDD